MAIDWGRVARGVGTGYLGAKIANTEANDKLNANIIERAGLNFYEKTLPEWQKKEKIREKEFKQVSSFFESDDAANWFADQGYITGDGTALANITEVLKAKKLDARTFKKDFKWEGSTYEGRKAERVSSIQDREKTIMGLTSGSSKIGNMTADLLIEEKAAVPDTDTGVVTDEVGANVPGTPIVPDQSGIAEQQISQTKATGLSDMFAPAAREIDVETKYQQIGKAIQEQFGYAQSMQLEGDQVNLNFGGMNKKIHNAHLAITQMIMRKSNMNNYDAAAAAKGFLNEFTIKPFMELEKTLGGKYIEHYGQTTANMGTGPIDVTTQMVSDGVSLKEYIFQQIDLLPKNQLGHTDPAILDRFIQNIPDNFKIGTEKFKTQLENSQKMEARQFKLT
jgi:hypothetical protein|tara:strand:- start:943 stop:2121 length:1179 start_codon:yes stop_codon:yes gene_type:complete